MLVELKCRNCNAALKDMPGRDRFFCPYCGALYIREQPVIISGTSVHPSDFEIRANVLIKYRGASLNPIVPDSVSVIGERAFANTMIHSVSLPESLCEIQAYAFLDCKKLQEIILPPHLACIGTRAFFRCFALKKIVWPSDGLPKMRYDDGFPFIGTPYYTEKTTSLDDGA